MVFDPPVSGLFMCAVYLLMSHAIHREYPLCSGILGSERVNKDETSGLKV
jgi:hypothetical protein